MLISKVMFSTWYKEMVSYCCIRQVQKIEVSGASAPVSALDFCFLSTSLAVGSESGLVWLFRFFFSGLNELMNYSNYLFFCRFVYIDLVILKRQVFISCQKIIKKVI